MIETGQQGKPDSGENSIITTQGKSKQENGRNKQKAVRFLHCCDRLTHSQGLLGERQMISSRSRSRQTLAKLLEHGGPKSGDFGYD